MVIIKVKGFKAGYTRAGGWKSEELEVAKAINRATQELDPRMAYIPDWENWVATQMIELFSGEAISFNEIQSEGEIY